MENGIRILVCDDHALFRSGVISLLKEDPSFFIVGEADNGEEMIKKYYMVKPDIIIADISMPVMSGIEALKELRKQGQEIKILFLSMLEEEQYVFHILQSGGSGLLSKNIIKGELFYAIKAINKGDKYFGVQYPEEKLEEIIEKYQLKFNRSKRYETDRMTEREEEILGYISKGLTSNQIAEKLFIGKRTIDTHRQHIMQKYGIKSLPGLIKFALEYFNSVRQA